MEIIDADANPSFTISNEAAGKIKYLNPKMYMK